MRKIVIRVAACIAALIVGLVAWLAFQWLPPRQKLVVSRETTWIVGPLLPDGTVDYEAAWKNERSKDLTPENNAAPFLFAALGVDPSKFSEAERAALPTDLVPFSDFETWRYEQEKSLPEDLRGEIIGGARAVDALENREWESPAGRLAVLWLDATSSSIAEIERVVRRDHMVASGVFHDSGPAWQMFEIYGALRGCAAIASEKGNADAAFAHLASALRLARLQRSLETLAHCMAAGAGEAATWSSALRIARRADRISAAIVRELIGAADPTDATERLRSIVTASRMYDLDFLVHPVPMSLVPNTEPSPFDRLVARIDPNRACRRLNESADRIEAAYCTGSWAARLDEVEKLQQRFLQAMAGSRSRAATLWMYCSRDAFGDSIVDRVIAIRPRYVLEQLLPGILSSERAFIELAALAYATENGRDPRSSDDLTPLLFSVPWRDRVTGSAVEFARQADGTLAARGPLIDLQKRFEDWSKETERAPAH